MRRVIATWWFVITFVDRGELSGEGGVRAAEVCRIIVGQGADDGDQIGEWGEVAEVFADAETGGCRGDRAKFAADLQRCGGFHIEGIKLTGAAPHKKEQAAFGGTETGDLTGGLLRGCDGECGQHSSESGTQNSSAADGPCWESERKSGSHFGGPVASGEEWLAGCSKPVQTGGLGAVLIGKVTCGGGRCPAFLG